MTERMLMRYKALKDSLAGMLRKLKDIAATLPTAACRRGGKEEPSREGFYYQASVSCHQGAFFGLILLPKPPLLPTRSRCYSDIANQGQQLYTPLCGPAHTASHIDTSHDDTTTLSSFRVYENPSYRLTIDEKPA